MNESKPYRYIITSGWWCDNDTSDDRAVKMGSSQNRQVGFFDLWYQCVERFTKPEKIIIIDSASPVTPANLESKNVHWVRLDHNPGHSTRSTGKYAGITYSHILGMMYTLLEDVDYWVYIEQDSLIYGPGIIEAAIASMQGGIMFGSGVGTPQPVQQSLMIVKKDHISTFVHHLSKIHLSDNILSPETKFAIAASPLLRKIPGYGGLYVSPNKVPQKLGEFLMRVARKVARGYDHLPFGYGRVRPLNMDDPYFYFQFGTDLEILQMAEKLKTS